MARLAKNLMLEGIRGSLGNELIFRKINNQTVVSMKPTRQKKGTVAQQENRGKFREASAYAKEQMKNPDRKAYYQKIARKLKLPNAYTAAITDFMRRPVVGNIECKQKKGVTINAKVTKQGFEVKEVTAIVRDGNNNIRSLLMRKKGENLWSAAIGDGSDIKSIRIEVVDFFENYGRGIAKLL